MVPASSRTRIPDACNATADGNSDVVVFAHEDRGAASKIVTWDPKALKIEATCTPVAPAPITSIDGEPRRSPGVAVGASQVEAGQIDSPCHATGADDELFVADRWCMGAFDQVRVDETGGAGVLVDVTPDRPALPQHRMGPHVWGDLPDAINQPRVVEPGSPAVMP